MRTIFPRKSSSLLVFLGLLVSAALPVSSLFADDLAELIQMAQDGDQSLQTTLGMAYMDGLGVGRDAAEGLKWLRLAADKDDAPAQLALARCYRLGKGVPKDEKQAMIWCRRAAESGDAEACYDLGLCCQHGLGVDKDDAMAVKWYQKAAGHGLIKAHYELGLCYLHGLGVKKDLVKAHARLTASSKSDIADLPLQSPPSEWTSASEDALHNAFQTMEQCAEALRQLEASMSPAELDEAEKLAASLKEKTSGTLAAASGGDSKSLVTADDLKVVGNSVFASEAVKKALAIEGREGLHWWGLMMKADELQAKYQEGGFADVQIHFALHPRQQKKGSMRLICAINEGERFTINKIQFEGLLALNEKEIASKMQSKPGGYFSKQALQTDARCIENLVKDLGYVYAQVTEFRREPVSGNKFNVVFVINEGDRFKVSEVAIEGHEAFGRSSLQPLLSIKPGSVCSESLVRSSKDRLNDFYHSRGYVDALVDCHIKDQDKDTIKITYQIIEGAKYCVGQINLAGNILTPARNILKEIHLSPGDLLDRTSLDKSRETLMKTGFFRHVDLRLTPTNKAGCKDIDITVVEQ